MIIICIPPAPNPFSTPLQATWNKMLLWKMWRINFLSNLVRSIAITLATILVLTQTPKTSHREVSHCLWLPLSRRHKGLWRSLHFRLWHQPTFCKCGQAVLQTLNTYWPQQWVFLCYGQNNFRVSASYKRQIAMKYLCLKVLKETLKYFFRSLFIDQKSWIIGGHIYVFCISCLSVAPKVPDSRAQAQAPRALAPLCACPLWEGKGWPYIYLSPPNCCPYPSSL